MAKEMTRYTAPNQKVIRVHKDSYNGSYLTIGTEEWHEAFKSLKRITFGVYLYLSGNANGFELTLSRRDVMNRLGVSKDTYLRAIKELEEKGYLVHKNGPVWNFYTTPVDMETDAKESDDDNESVNNESGESESSENVGGMVAYTQPSCMRTSNHNGSVEATDMVAYTHTEINKYRETDNTDNVASRDDECTDGNERTDETRAETDNDWTAEAFSKERPPKEERPREMRGAVCRVNDIDFLESLPDEEITEMYDFFHETHNPNLKGLKKHLSDRYGVTVKDIKKFYDNMCLYGEGL